MPDETLLTLRQLAQELSLPESTVRYYRDAFLDHIPSVGSGRRRRYPREAVSVLREIARSYAAGRPKADIEAGIRHQGASHAGVAVSELAPQPRAIEEVSNLDLLAAILDGEREQRDALWQMAKEIVRLAEVLEGQDKVLVEIADRAGVAVESRPAALHAGPVSAVPAPATVAPPVPAAAAPDPAPPRVSAPFPAPPERAAATAAPAPMGGDVDRLRQELEAERALVERLRESKLQLEHRAADAEAALTETRERRTSVIGRLLGKDDR